MADAQAFDALSIASPNHLGQLLFTSATAIYDGSGERPSSWERLEGPEWVHVRKNSALDALGDLVAYFFADEH